MPGKWETTCGCVFLYMKHPECTVDHFVAARSNRTPQISAPPGDGCPAPTTPREE